jgi:hypothetical protein
VENKAAPKKAIPVTKKIVKKAPVPVKKIFIE